MHIDGPGPRIAGPFPILGGTADLRHRGVIIAGGRGNVVVDFRFPMIGRPSIVTPDAALGTIQYESGSWRVDDLERAVHSALRGRLGVRATGSMDSATSIDLGPATAIRGGGTQAVGYEMSCTAALQHRVLYDVVALGDDGLWTVIAPHAFYARSEWQDFGVAHITDMHVARRIDTAHNNANQVGYRGVDGHVYELWWTGVDPVSGWDLSAISGGT